MYRQQAYYIANIVMVIDALIIIAGAYGALSLLGHFFGQTLNINSLHFYGLIICMLFLNNYVMTRSGFYSDKRLSSLFSIVLKIFYAVCIEFTIFSVALFLTGLDDVPRPFIFLYGILVFIGFVVEKICLDLYLTSRENKDFNSRRILIVGTDERAKIVYNGLKEQRSWGHKIVGCLKASSEDKDIIQNLPVLGELKNFKEILLKHQIDEVVFALPQGKPKNLQHYLNVCELLGVSARIVPGMFDPNSARSRMSVEAIQGIPTIAFHFSGINATGLFYKRILDFVGGLIGMFLLAIIFPFVAIAIKLDSPGPVLFKQKRVGQNGRVFWLYKFRTMYQDAEERKKELMAKNEMKGLMFKMKDDPRITRVGRFLRRTSLDEFPQFINVIKGEMSLVGTRPPTLDEVSQYELWHRRRVSMKPGITGLWQVSGRNKINDFNKVVELDLQYIDGWRFSHDIVILLKTIWVVLKRKGAS
ncbi:sugar transferase [Desulfovulcanus sp.]